MYHLLLAQKRVTDSRLAEYYLLILYIFSLGKEETGICCSVRAKIQREEREKGSNL